LVVGVLSYVPGKCTTVIVVNWAKIGRSRKDRKFRVQSSLFRSLWIERERLLKVSECKYSLAKKSFARGGSVGLPAFYTPACGGGGSGELSAANSFTTCPNKAAMHTQYTQRAQSRGKTQYAEQIGILFLTRGFSVGARLRFVSAILFCHTISTRISGLH
jgi:hypothetical protein